MKQSLSILGALQLLFITLKLVGEITWDWVIVFIPFLACIVTLASTAVYILIDILME